MTCRVIKTMDNFLVSKLFPKLIHDAFSFECRIEITVQIFFLPYLILANREKKKRKRARLALIVTPTIQHPDSHLRRQRTALDGLVIGAWCFVVLTDSGSLILLCIARGVCYYGCLILSPNFTTWIDFRRRRKKKRSEMEQV